MTFTLHISVHGVDRMFPLTVSPTGSFSADLGVLPGLQISAYDRANLNAWIDTDRHDDPLESYHVNGETVGGLYIWNPDGSESVIGQWQIMLDGAAASFDEIEAAINDTLKRKE